MNGRSERELSVNAICHIRMQEWTKEMVDANATPVFSLAMSHDTHELHLYVPENLASDDLALFLAYALSEIQKKAA
jgi:hypothetical protein